MEDARRRHIMPPRQKEGLLLPLQNGLRTPRTTLILQQYHNTQRINPMALMTEADWHQERLTTYLDISRSVKDSLNLVRKAEDAIKALGLEQPFGSSAIDFATAIFRYNAAYKKDADANLDSVLDGLTSVQEAEKAFERSKKLALEAYELLCCEEYDYDEEVFRKVKEVKAARDAVRGIVEEDLVAWEKRVAEVAEAGRMLTA